MRPKMKSNFEPSPRQPASCSRAPWAGLLAILISLSLTGCGERFKNPAIKEAKHEANHPAKDTGQRLVLLVRQDYMDEAILEDFRKEFGVTVVEQNYQDNEQLLRRLKRQNKCDVLITSGSMIQEMEERGFLLEIDHVLTNRPNLAQPIGGRLPYDLRFCIPYTWRSLGIGYVSEHETEIPESWRVIFEPGPEAADRLKDKIIMFNEPRYVIGTALLYLGFSPNSTNLTEIQKAGELLLKQRPLVGEYSEHDSREELVKAQSTMAQALSSDIAIGARQNHTLRFAIPKEGTVVFVDNLAIPTICENKELAALFVGFLIRPDIAARVSNRSYCASLLHDAEPLISPLVRNGPSYQLPDDDSKIFFIKSVGSEVQDEYNKVWRQVLGGKPVTIPVAGAGASDVK